MENSELLFIYGTLENPETQLEVLGRVTKNTPDHLKGYKKSQIEIDGGTYPLIVPDAKNVVYGSVIEVTRDELKKIDEYETDAYKRERVFLESGKSAWVFLKR